MTQFGSTHVTGESEFIDDRPRMQGELTLGLFLSTVAHARIRSIDLSQALKIPGVVNIYLGKDFATPNWGPLVQDQPLLAQDIVQYFSEPIALIAAESTLAIEKAKSAIRITYEPLPPILTIREALAQNSFLGIEKKIERGDIASAMKKHATLKGTLVIRGQDHFYLESQAAIAYPQDHGQIEVHSSSQHATETQHIVARALGLDFKDVNVIVKRMGGAFGGKESQAAPFAAYAALVAHKLKRPARIAITKDEDMAITGKRNPFEIDYQVAFDPMGMIQGLDAQFYSDAGAYLDLSPSIMERALMHADNAYFIPHFRATGRLLKTNHHSNTAFRGFGGPKGVALIESIIEEIAATLKVDALDLRLKNCYSRTNGRNTTPYGQALPHTTLPELFRSIESTSNYRKRRQEISQWNATSPLTVRGLSCTAVKFGISFTTRFLNQGNALVHVLTDGSIQVATGATEMGQGVQAKIGKIVAESFGVEPAMVRVLPTSTDKNANTSPTAASSGSDLNGKAAQQACEAIRSRLAQVARHVVDLPTERYAAKTAGLGTEPEFELKMNGAHLKAAQSVEARFEKGRVWVGTKSISWIDCVREAFFSRISLSEQSFFKIPGIDFNKLTGKGNPFYYFTEGVAVSEVEINRFTGELRVNRADILMDLGRPIVESIDRGQVIGGFIQGQGWVTSENLAYSPAGQLLSHSPTTYKIPNVQDIPRLFNVELVANVSNPVNVSGSKAVGEPPLLLGLSVWTAIKDALRAPIPIPATLEDRLMRLSQK